MKENSRIGSRQMSKYFKSKSFKHQTFEYLKSQYFNHDLTHEHPRS